MTTTNYARRLIVLLALALAGCATTPEKEALKAACKRDAEAAKADHRCYHAPKVDTRGMIKVCEGRGSIKSCYYVDREEAQRVINEILIQ